MNTEDPYTLLPSEKCYAKDYRNYFETYNSHVGMALAFVKPVMNIYQCKYPFNYIENVVKLHDVGKRGIEYQDMIAQGKKQFIRHEELAFIKWLDEDPELKCLDIPQALAILAHHKSLIDDDMAIIIERYICNHENWRELSKKWLSILKTPREKRIDNKLFLPALPILDVLRTIDILASYTTETVLLQKLGLPRFESVFHAARTDLSRELSSVNLKGTGIDFKILLDSEEHIKVQVLKPVSSVVEYHRRRQ